MNQMSTPLENENAITRDGAMLAYLKHLISRSSTHLENANAYPFALHFIKHAFSNINDLLFDDPFITHPLS